MMYLNGTLVKVKGGRVVGAAGRRGNNNQLDDAADADWVPIIGGEDTKTRPI